MKGSCAYYEFFKRGNYTSACEVLATHWQSQLHEGPQLAVITHIVTKYIYI